MGVRGAGVCKQGPDKNIVARAGSGRKKFRRGRDRPGNFLHEPVLPGFFFKSQSKAMRTYGRVWGRACGDGADPGPDWRVSSSIVGTGGTEERWQSAGKIIPITEITNQKNPDFSLKKGIFSSNIPQLPPALSQTTHQNPEPRSSGGPKKPATDL